MKDETRGNRDKWRGVRDGMEIEWSQVRGGYWSCSREGVEQKWSYWRSISDLVSHRVPPENRIDNRSLTPL